MMIFSLDFDNCFVVDLSKRFNNKPKFIRLSFHFHAISNYSILSFYNFASCVFRYASLHPGPSPST